jgi:hypothetical protein
MQSVTCYTFSIVTFNYTLAEGSHMKKVIVMDAAKEHCTNGRPAGMHSTVVRMPIPLRDELETLRWETRLSINAVILSLLHAGLAARATNPALQSIEGRERAARP